MSILATSLLTSEPAVRTLQTGCHYQLVLNYLPVTIVSRVCLIVADLVVLGVTLRGTYRTTQMARVVSNQGMRTFSGTLLLDGTLWLCSNWVWS